MTELKKITGIKAEKAGTTGICAGANLRTPCGPRRVEYLRQGDLVVTRDNGLQPVRMVWTRKVTAAEIAADPSLAPVTLKPRAIAPMMPQKDVAVGGGHRLLIPGWRFGDEDASENSLVAARDVEGLAGGDPDREPQEITYYNIVFDEPQVFHANGMPVESFTPSSDSTKNLPKDVIAIMRETFPDLGPKYKNYPAPVYKMRERQSYIPDYA